ncbi:hypothetical protein HH214_08455 [Mucilaginibacter robiniae]|uniref:Uncharacterized protein n=1 Tax=Mucilaginibacter robiniae TaxID=2728022 RepID=A0A7L5DXR3_9SPHI|nr:hypothetical protein [Mucilaginibacter robiniae]QJD95902.1 hypothetical protein HH214_08455 [Mucilaginibacter robiniae]
MDSYQVRKFEFNLSEIYNQTPWLQDEIALNDFIALFPITFKNGLPQRPEMPEDFDLDRTTRLAIMVAYRQAFS